MDRTTYRFRVGACECIAVQEGALWSTADFAFANAPREPLVKALRRHGLPGGQMLVPLTCLIMKTGGQTVLLDTGLGSGIDASVGQLILNLKREGLEPKDIDLVLLSHGHLDHIGGNTDDNGAPAFPKARYVMWQDEWDFWTSEANLSRVDGSWASFARKNLPPLCDRIELMDHEQDVAPGIRVIPAGGHTPGHMAVILSSAGEQLLTLGDAAGHPIHLEHPDWYILSDWKPAEALETRSRLLAWASENHALLFGYHFPFPGLGRVIVSERGWEWQPVNAGRVHPATTRPEDP